MAEFVRSFPGRRVVIDHHVSQDDLGALFIKDTGAEATGILVMSAVAALGAMLTREVATGLLTAIAMDTGWFRHTNTRPGTLRAAAELIEAGADIAEIYRDLFESNTLGRLRLMGETLSGLRTDMGGRVAYATISRADLERTGAIPQDSEDMIDFTVSLRGVDVGMLFIEQARGGVKVSLRSRNGLDSRNWPRHWAVAGTEPRPGPPSPGQWPRTWTACSAVRQALDPPRFPRKDKRTGACREAWQAPSSLLLIDPGPAR